MSEQKGRMAILIVGDEGTDKTTVQRIIGRALQDHGIEFTLGSEAQRENNLLGSYRYDQEESALVINDTTTVVVEEIETGVLNHFASEPNPLIGFRGYDHSAGFKIIPVYKDKS